MGIKLIKKLLPIQIIMYEVRQKISNHPVLTDLERDVVMYRVADNMDVKQMPISARIGISKMLKV